MSGANGRLVVNGEQRELIIQAAVAYDETQKQINNLEDQLGGRLPPWKQRNSRLIISICC